MSKSVAAVLLVIALLMSPAVRAAERIITLSVPGMDCAACPIIVKSSLEGVPGVLKVVVSYADKAAVVTFDDQKTVPSALMAATADVGYPSDVRE